MKYIVSKSVEIAEMLLTEIKKNKRDRIMIGLRGDLGAGKTATVQQLGKLLGVKEPIASPTFNLVKIYDLPDNLLGFKKLCHIDLYRLNKPSPADVSEIIEQITSQGVISAIEWPENSPQISQIVDVTVEIKPISPTRREVEIKWS